MQTLRASYKLLVFLLLSTAVLLMFYLGLAIACFLEQGRIRWKNRLISRWAAGIAGLLGMKIQIKGNVPEPPFFLVSNHLSYIDILPFWKHLQTTFVAKSEIESWPFFGLASRLLGIIFINRENRKDINRVNSLIAENINARQGVIVFPEGTSTKGEKVLPFKSSLLHYPAAENLSVHYASISYYMPDDGTGNAWKDVCWWGDMDFLNHFWNLLKIKSFTVSVQFGESAVSHKNRKILTRTLHQKVAEGFEPTFRQ